MLRTLDKTVDFRIANSIWYRTGFPFETTFLDESKQFFDARSRRWTSPPRARFRRSTAG
jgi:serine protease inhibitor